MLRKKDSEAKQLIGKVVEKIIQLYKKEKESTTIGAMMEQAKNPTTADSSELPSLEFRMQTCRYLIEL